jgi:hypothetical protein
MGGMRVIYSRWGLFLSNFNFFCSSSHSVNTNHDDDSDDAGISIGIASNSSISTIGGIAVSISISMHANTASEAHYNNIISRLEQHPAKQLATSLATVININTDA